MLHIYVDADGCPVREEIFRVARRCELDVTLVANAWMDVPGWKNIELVTVGDAFDAADDWIVEHVEAKDIVITGDIPLASRCLAKGCRVLGIRGKEFTEHTIGEALAAREMLANLREMGVPTRGQKPLEKKDRSRFLQELDRIIQALRRGK